MQRPHGLEGAWIEVDKAQYSISSRLNTVIKSRFHSQQDGKPEKPSVTNTVHKTFMGKENRFCGVILNYWFLIQGWMSVFMVTYFEFVVAM